MTKLKGAICDLAKAPNNEFIMQNETFETPQLEGVCVIVCVCVCVRAYIYIYIYIYIQGVTGGTDQTSGGCSLC